MEKADVEPFAVGTVFNPLSVSTVLSAAPLKRVTIKYPSRLEAMALDPSKIALNANMKYAAGQIDFTVKLFRTVSVELCNQAEGVTISEHSKRKPLIRHAEALMRSALGYDDGLLIEVADQVYLRHCGLGSSSGLIASVCCAINELFGKPIPARALVKYAAQNHGEEIDGEEHRINPVQCIGGSAACGTHDGGLLVVAGESCVIKAMDVAEDYDVVIAIPNDFQHPDSKYLLDKEIEYLPRFIDCGKRYGGLIAYRLVHECFPAMENGDLKVIGDLIYDYRFTMGSIENCSFVYPPLVGLANSLAYLKLKGIADVLSISSVGPGMFAITRNGDVCEAAFRVRDMTTMRTKIHNGQYVVTEREGR